MIATASPVKARSSECPVADDEAKGKEDGASGRRFGISTEHGILKAEGGKQIRQGSRERQRKTSASPGINEVKEVKATAIAARSCERTVAAWGA